MHLAMVEWFHKALLFGEWDIVLEKYDGLSSQGVRKIRKVMFDSSLKDFKVESGGSEVG